MYLYYLKSLKNFSHKLIILAVFILSSLLIVQDAKAVTYTVTKTAETSDGTCDADCSLSEAVTAANANSGEDTIEFQIPTSDGGYNSSGDYFSLSLGTMLTLSDNDGVYINGYSQSGASRNTASFGNTINTVLKIQITTSSLGTMFTLTGDNNHITGLNITGHSTETPGQKTIFNINGSSENFIEGNFLGSNISGTSFGGSSLNIIQNTSANNVIGTNGDGNNDVGERNLFMGSSSQYKITFQNGTNNNNTIIAGNYMGVDKTGRACETATQGRSIISIFEGTGNRIGTNLDGISDDEEANIMACVNVNARGLIQLGGTESSNLIQGNYLGTNPYGDNLRGSFAEPAIYDNGTATDNVIRKNIIKYTGTVGMIFDGSSSNGNTLRENIITNTTGIPIDLGTSGVTLNDSNDEDTGANDLMNFPTITRVNYLSNGKYQVSGTLNRKESEGPFTIEVCESDSHSSGYGGCISSLGTTTDINSDGAWQLEIIISGDNGNQTRTFSALATNTNGSTSEFGANASYLPTTSTAQEINEKKIDIGAFQKGIVSYLDTVFIIEENTFPWDTYLSFDSQPRIQPLQITTANGHYWQVSAQYYLWWKAFFNDARILFPLKPFIFAIRYTIPLPDNLPIKNLQLAYSPDGKKWQVLSYGIHDSVNKTVAIYTKLQGYFMLVSGYPF